MGHAHRPSFKGCCGMCALQDGRVRGQGWSARMLPAERNLVGRSRRVSRGEIPADQLDEGLTWAPRVVDGRAEQWTDYEAAEPELVKLLQGWEHIPVNAAPTHDDHGWRLFGPHADVCWACSDFSAGRLVPVSFCPEALAVYEAEEAWLRDQLDKPWGQW